MPVSGKIDTFCLNINKLQVVYSPTMSAAVTTSPTVSSGENMASDLQEHIVSMTING